MHINVIGILVSKVIRNQLRPLAIRPTYGQHGKQNKTPGTCETHLGSELRTLVLQVRRVVVHGRHAAVPPVVPLRDRNDQPVLVHSHRLVMDHWRWVVPIK